MRGDLADVRLADRVFAPHYAAPMAVELGQPVALREAADANSPIIVEIAAGEVFEVFELAGSNAWGIACDSGLVGYIDAAAIGGRAK
ncbi:SH3 domain-containing protein [Sphingomonas sp. GB1N7]|uniref:SH3 domain-containing protein n=1 Tax=Parasphingomonas caseinilytica TaxID=3096158 RepID=UPI002FCC827A